MGEGKGTEIGEEEGKGLWAMDAVAAWWGIQSWESESEAHPMMWVNTGPGLMPMPALVRAMPKMSSN